MKPNNNVRKTRSRNHQSNKGRKPSGPGNSRQDHNKPKGNPKQMLDKYKQQATDAQRSGDRIQAEYYFQFADHYQRLLNERNANQTERRSRSPRRNDDNGDDAASEEAANTATPSEPKAAPAVKADKDFVDPTEQEQPTEVHPELDASGAPVEQVKPRRGRRPRRKPVSDDGAPNSDEAA